MKKKKYNSNLNTRYPGLKYIVKITGSLFCFCLRATTIRSIKFAKETKIRYFYYALLHNGIIVTQEFCCTGLG